MGVYTGAGSSVFYEFESTFGTAPSTINEIFGLNTRVGTLSTTTNRIELGLLGQVEPTAYAFGQQAIRMSTSFTFDSRTSHKIFGSIYGEDSSSPHAYPPTLGENQAPTAPKSLSAVINVNTAGESNTLLKRTLSGGVIQSLGLSTSIGQTVDGTCDMVFGKESSVTNDSSSFTEQSSVSVAGTPYTFAHGTFKVANGSSSYATIGEIQSLDLSINQNAELLYKLGSHQAVDAYRRVLEISGRFRTSWKDKTHLQHLIDQATDATALTNKGGILENSNVACELTFNNPEDNNKDMIITLKGLAFDDHTVSGLEPVEPLFEDLSFHAQALKVVARSS